MAAYNIAGATIVILACPVRTPQQPTPSDLALVIPTLSEMEEGILRCVLRQDRCSVGARGEDSIVVRAALDRLCALNLIKQVPPWLTMGMEEYTPPWVWPEAYPRSPNVATKEAAKRRRQRIQASEEHYTHAEWNALKSFYRYRCVACGRYEPDIILVADHVVPLEKGGSDGIGNIQPLCTHDNAVKYTKIIDYRSQPSAFSPMGCTLT